MMKVLWVKNTKILYWQARHKKVTGCDWLNLIYKLNW